MKFAFSSEYVINTEHEPWATKGLRVGFYATSGQGKSLNAAILAEQWLDQGGTVVIFEPLAEWHTLKQAYQIQVIGGPHAQDLPLVESQPKLYAHAVIEQGISMIFYTRDIEDEEQLVEFVRVFIHEMMTLEELHHRPVLLILEETHEYAPKTSRGHVAPPWVYSRMTKVLKDCFTQGRKLNITPVAITQRPQEVNFTIRQLVNYAWFGGFSSQDANYIDKEILADYRKEGYDISKSDLINVPTGHWTVVAEGDIYKVDVPRAMRKTPHGADTPKLEYVQPVDVSTQEAISNLSEKLSKMLEKAQEEKTELERVKRQLREAQKKIEEHEQRTRTGEDLKKLLQNVMNTDGGGGVDKEVINKLEEQHRQKFSEINEELQNIKNTWTSPEEANEMEKHVAELESQMTTVDLLAEVLTPIIEPVVRKMMPTEIPSVLTEKDVESIIERKIASLPAQKRQRIETPGDTGIPWVDLYMPKLKSNEAKILRYIAVKHPLKVTKRDISMSTGISFTSSGLTAGLTKLKKWRLIEQIGSDFKLMEAPP